MKSTSLTRADEARAGAAANMVAMAIIAYFISNFSLKARRKLPAA
jgi:hypothetical protein